MKKQNYEFNLFFLFCTIFKWCWCKHGWVKRVIVMFLEWLWSVCNEFAAIESCFYLDQSEDLILKSNQSDASIQYSSCPHHRGAQNTHNPIQWSHQKTQIIFDSIDLERRYFQISSGLLFSWETFLFEKVMLVERMTHMTTWHMYIYWYWKTFYTKTQRHDICILVYLSSLGNNQKFSF